MPRSTHAQQDDITAAVECCRTLVNQLQVALRAAGETDQDEVVQALLPRLQDAIDLHAAAVNMQTIRTVQALKPWALAFKASADALKKEADKIHQAVKAVSTVATVLGTIAQVATTAASLLARL